GPLRRRIVFRGGNRNRPDRVPGLEVRRGAEQQAGREPQPRPATPGLPREPEIAERERTGEQPQCHVVRDSELLQAVRKRKLSLLVRVAGERPEGLEPVPAELRARGRDEHKCREREAEVPDSTSTRASLERPQRQ